MPTRRSATIAILTSLLFLIAGVGVIFTNTLIQKFRFNLIEGLISGLVHLALFGLTGTFPAVPLIAVFLFTT